MSILLFAGLFVCSGCGYTPYTPYVDVLGIIATGPVRAEVEWDASDKMNTGNGYHLAVRPSFRVGSRWYLEPGAVWSRQSTPLWVKDATYMRVSGGYHWPNLEAWGGVDVPIDAQPRYRRTHRRAGTGTVRAGVSHRTGTRAVPAGRLFNIPILGGVGMEIIPIELAEANEFVRVHHRHHKPVIGHKFSLAVEFDGIIRGVAIVGRPVARGNDNGLTLEVTRVATDGTKNACSALYGACRRAAFALGYRRLITYTLNSETGSSLRGSGWKLLGERGGGSWNCQSRPRIDKHPLQTKLLWEAPL